MKRIKLLLLFALVSISGHAQHWNAVPFSFDKKVTACIPDAETDSMYIIGDFGIVNGEQANVVQWNGDTGFSYQKVLGGGVDDITTYQGKTFACVGGIILRKDDTGWYWTNDPNWDQAYKFLRLGDKLMVGMEHYEPAAWQPTIRLAVWTGAVWKDTLRYDTVDTQNISPISSIAYYNGQLYVAGVIRPSGRPAMRGIIRYDGTKWTDVGGGIITGGAGYISKLLVWRGRLYACGSFFESDGAPGNDIAQWDGTYWRPLGKGLTSGFGSGAIDMQVYNDELYVVGNFSQAGGVTADGIAKWDGQKWCTLRDDFGGGTDNVVVFKGNMYVSGGWNTINGNWYNHMAKWGGGTFGDSCSTPLAVIEPSEPRGSLLYPSPVSTALFIQLPDVQRISVYDIQGRVVLRTAHYSPSTGIDVRALHPGIYLARIEGKAGVITQRFIKE